MWDHYVFCRRVISLLSDVGGETQEDAAKWVHERRRNRWISSIRKISSRQSMAYWITVRSICCLLIQFFNVSLQPSPGPSLTRTRCSCWLTLPTGAARTRMPPPATPSSGVRQWTVTSIIKFVTFQVETLFVKGEMWYSTPRIPATSSLSLWRSFGYVTM